MLPAVLRENRENQISRDSFLIVLLIIVGCILTFIKGSPLYINSVIIWVGAICLIFIVISDFNKFKEAILNESI